MALVLHELRTVLAALARRYHFTFAPEFEAGRWIDQLKDRYLLIRGPLNVVLAERLGP